jgi:guanine deaminase
MQNKHEEWMNQAIDLALNNVRTGRGGPFGAVIVKGDQIIATGVNSVTATKDPTAHAEIVAIRAACEFLGTHQLHGCHLFSSCEPCPMCLGAIYWARPDSYYFSCTRSSAAEAGFDDSYIYEQLHLKPEERAIPGHCVLTEKGHAPFVEWAQSLQKIHY